MTVTVPGILYHGTSSRFFGDIMTKGIRPRGDTGAESIWEKVPSVPDRVYLTNCYAPYYAVTATDEGDFAVTFQIDTRKIKGFFVADEDAIEQTSRASRDGKGIIPFSEELMIQRTAEAAASAIQMAQTGQFTAGQSLAAMGTCALVGHVPPEAIKGYVVTEPMPTIFAWDAIPGILNYRYLGEAYKEQTKMLFKKDTQVYKNLVAPAQKSYRVAIDKNTKAPYIERVSWNVE